MQYQNSIKYEKDKLKTSQSDSTEVLDLKNEIPPIGSYQHFLSLQLLDLTRNSFGKKAIQSISCNSTLKNLRSLTLTDNPIGNDGIKYFADTSSWTKLQVLTLQNTLIDHQGVKWLAINESWINLKELDLRQNPRIGALGAISLSLNRTWINLIKISLCDCDLGPLGTNILKSNKHLKRLFVRDYGSCAEAEDHNCIDLKDKMDLGKKCLTKTEKVPFSYYSNRFDRESLKESKSYLRGGFPQDHDSSNTGNSELLTKISQYKEKILNDLTLKKKLSLYMAARGSSESTSASFELAPYIDLQFLNIPGDVSKVLLLTGQAGIGKSIFCRHLQREILSNSIDSETKSPDFNDWLPIYVELASLKNSKSEVIPETLVRELALTEEEIHLLQTADSSTSQLPRLLFIFDGYASIENDQHLYSLNSEKDYINNNFCALNNVNVTSWKNAKFIFTCREESLLYVKRRDLLFALLTGESTELSTSGSFLQVKVEPFSDEQITSYLKLYIYSRSTDALEEKETSLSISNTKSSSWPLAEKFKKIIDDYKLREVARIPLMLWILCHILPHIAEKGISQVTEENLTQPKILSNRSLIEMFVNQVAQAIAKKALGTSDSSGVTSYANSEDGLKNLVQQLILQFQRLALRLSSYSKDSVTATTGKEEADTALLELYPVIEWENTLRRVRFSCPLLLDFFVARSIEEEIIELTASSLDKSVSGPNSLLLNQRLLTGKALYSPVTLFLLDAVKDEKIKANQLVDLLHLLRKGSPGIQEPVQSGLQSPFSIALSNTISLLNSTKYDFRNHDLSNISIPGANLTRGKFEGANFTNADLRDIDFNGASLVNAIFVKANMESIIFEEASTIPFKNQEISSITLSLERKYFAVGIGDQTVIYNSCDGNKFRLKELRRLPGYFSGLKRNPFSIDGKQILTIEGKENLEERDDCDDEEEEEYSDEDEEEYPEQDEDNEEEDEANDDVEDNEQESDDENNEDDEEEDGQGKKLRKKEKKQNKHIKKEEKPLYSLNIWNVSSGVLLKKFQVPIVPRRNIIFSPDLKEFALFQGKKKVQKYTVATDRWVDYSIRIRKKIVNCDISADSDKLLLVGDYKKQNVLCNSNTGKAIHKQRQKITHCKFNRDGKQIVSGTSRGLIHLSDSVRGYIIKTFSNNDDDEWTKKILSCSFNLDGKQVLSATSRRLTIQNVTNGEFVYTLRFNSTPNSNEYSLDPELKHLALIEYMKGVRLEKITELNGVADRTVLPIQGANTEGLNLNGTVVSSCPWAFRRRYSASQIERGLWAFR